MKFFWIVMFLCLGIQQVFAQETKAQRSSLHFIYGSSGANIRDFNDMLADKGISPLRKGYNTFGMAYQSRFNDFVLGLELIHNNGPTSSFREYDIDYRSTRLYFTVGHAFTEEDQRFQLIHYMSLGTGYMNFEMLREEEGRSIGEFLGNPAQGFIIRQNDLHKGTLNMGGFLTEIGFQLSYDIPLPGAEETLEFVTKFGYSFSPFENAWNNNGIAFDNILSGAFFRMGAGISLPEKNFFYRDASLAAHFFYGLHFSKPHQLNEQLSAHGLNELNSNSPNFGLKIIGANRGRLYGLDFYNLSKNGTANEEFDHTLNSVRVYGNLGRKLFERKNFEVGVLGGIGFGNISYTMNSKDKPDFPFLFEEPDFDGHLTDWGLMAKPEIHLSYVMPISRQKAFNLVYSLHTGYELPLSNYDLADLDMRKFMRGPYLQVGVGIRP